jgi:hypothetical protein
MKQNKSGTTHIRMAMIKNKTKHPNCWAQGLKPVILAVLQAQSRLQFKANLGKKLMRTPSQPMAGLSGTCLSSQLQGS